MNKNYTLTEASLIANCLKGDRKYQKALYEMYAPRLFAICLRYTKNHMDAEDVLQDGFIKLFNNLHRFKGEGSFEGWIRRIFVNTTIEHLRGKKVVTTAAEIFENAISDKQPTALDNLYNKDLTNTFKTLSPGYQTIFNLYAVEGYSHKEIANKLGITESTSKSQYSRAKAFLRTVVDDRRHRHSHNEAMYN
jgi:RNA polymerase sigma factor (sigma-70 family)